LERHGHHRYIDQTGKATQSQVSKEIGQTKDPE
jgi:hypothetical protein